MKSVRLLAPIVFLLMLVSPAHSQEYPQWEIFGGFDYVRMGAQGATFLGQPFNLPQNASGWHITATENAASWIGGIIDVSGDYANSTVNFGTPADPFNVRFNTQTYPILCGPRFYLRKFSSISVFGQPMIGATVMRLNFASASLLDAKPLTEAHWAYAFGGGADYDLNDRFAIRVQGDWIRSHFPQTFVRDFQNNFRVSGGIVFKIR